MYENWGFSHEKYAFEKVFRPLMFKPSYYYFLKNKEDGKLSWIFKVASSAKLLQFEKKLQRRKRIMKVEKDFSKVLKYHGETKWSSSSVV